MKKIQYYDLQKKYPGKMVILNRSWTKILAQGKKLDQLLKTVTKKEKIPLSNIVVVGPVQKAGTINVYFSLSSQNS